MFKTALFVKIPHELITIEKEKIKMDTQLLIDMNKPPTVLLLGNGVLLLNNGMGWTELLSKLSPGDDRMPDVTGIPYAMQPEAIRGTDVEEVQRLIASNIQSQNPHEILKQLVFMDFDAIITPNYTYEIETALLGGKWTENRRKKCHKTLYGSSHVRYNTYKCNLVKDIKGREIPVFHIHGEQARKHSMILSYYSYADAVYHLIEMNKQRKNEYEEHQISGIPLICKGWLDYFLLGEVYAIGFGFDLSEFDIWWAIERKNREYALNGKLHAYMIGEKQDPAKSTMFRAMGVDERFLCIENHQYEKAYWRAVQEI